MLSYLGAWEVDKFAEASEHLFLDHALLSKVQQVVQACMILSVFHSETSAAHGRMTPSASFVAHDCCNHGFMLFPSLHSQIRWGTDRCRSGPSLFICSIALKPPLVSPFSRSPPQVPRANYSCAFPPYQANNIVQSYG